MAEALCIISSNLLLSMRCCFCCSWLPASLNMACQSGFQQGNRRCSVLYISEHHCQVRFQCKRVTDAQDTVHQSTDASRNVVVNRCEFAPVQGILKDVELLQSITEACRESVRAFVERRTNTAGRVTTETLSEGIMRFAGLGAEPWTQPLKVCNLQWCSVCNLSCSMHTFYMWLLLGLLSKTVCEPTCLYSSVCVAHLQGGDPSHEGLKKDFQAGPTLPTFQLRPCKSCQAQLHADWDACCSHSIEQEIITAYLPPLEQDILVRLLQPPEPRTPSPSRCLLSMILVVA